MNPIERYKSLSVQVKSALWYTICSFIQKGISFIVVPLYIRLITTEEYGEWTDFESWRDILLVFASLNLYCGVFTKAIVDHPDDRDRYTSCMQSLGTLVSGVMFVIYALTHQWCNRVIGMDTIFMCFLFVFFIVQPAFSFWCTRQRVEYRYKKLIVATLLVAILTPAVSITLLSVTDLRAKALILGYLIVHCGVGLVFYIFQFIKGKCVYDKVYWKYALGYNIPLIPHYLSLIILSRADRIMIKHYCGKSDEGIYGFAYSIASAINVLISSINGARVPWTYEQLKDRKFASLKKITTALVLLMSTITLLVCLLCPEVLFVMGTEEYKIAVYVIPVVTIGVFFTFVYDLFASIEFYYGATRYVMYASVTGAVLNILLNAIFIPMYGFIAAAYTTLFCYFLFMVMHYIFSRIVIKKNKIDDKIYDCRTIFLICGVTVLAGLASMITYEHTIIRLVIIAAIMIGCIIKRKNIIELIKTIRK